MKIIVTCLIAVIVHLMLGWAWTFGVAMGGGWWTGKRGWLTGGIGVGTCWLILLGYNGIVAPGPTHEFARIFAGLVGDLPPFLTYVMVLVIGLLLGMLGGVVGSQLRSLLRPAPMTTGWST